MPQEILGSHDFIGECYQTFTEEIIAILQKLCQKIVEEGTLSISFYEPHVTLIESYE